MEVEVSTSVGVARVQPLVEEAVKMASLVQRTDAAESE